MTELLTSNNKSEELVYFSKMNVYSFSGVGKLP